MFAADQITRELVCEGDQRMFRCAPRTYLRIYNATFGRTSNTTCLDPDQGEVNETNCQSEPDVGNKVHTTCTGRMTCIASAYNDALGDPCPGVHKYLDVYFSCEGKVLLKRGYTYTHTHTLTHVFVPVSVQVRGTLYRNTCNNTFLA